MTVCLNSETFRSDCIYENILMDASGMFPEGFHPVLTLFTPDIQTIAKCVPRRDASPPVKYYFIDYGISSHFAPGQLRLVVGHHGIDQTVPELSCTQLYDPFKVDIFLIGCVFLEIFWQVRTIRTSVALVLMAVLRGTLMSGFSGP